MSLNIGLYLVGNRNRELIKNTDNISAEGLPRPGVEGGTDHKFKKIVL